MYRPWAASPALQVVSSVRLDTPVLARHAFRWSSHAGFATGTISTCRGAPEAGRTARSPSRSPPSTAMARLRLIWDAEPASAPNTRLEVAATPCTTTQGALSCTNNLPLPARGEGWEEGRGAQKSERRRRHYADGALPRAQRSLSLT